MSHTKGPWLLTESGDFVYALNDRGYNKFSLQVSSAHTEFEAGPEEVRATARLISAAPEMHTHLLNFESFLSRLIKSDEFGDITDLIRWRTEVQQTLAKIRGEI